MSRPWLTVDGNEAAASIAHRASEVIAIYPITPSSTMGELADEWSAAGKRNVFGTVPEVQEMQSEAGAIGVVHGALQAGVMATTFTASQGLLLMIPNMYKIAGELTPLCMHVAARAVATHALSIFGDHSDVMACRQTGFALLASGSVQEAHDLALVGHAATLRARVPVLHFFDGFRTSHEVAKIEALGDDDVRALLDPACIAAHRARALTPDRPVLRGTAQNPDTFFQAREAANPFFSACPHHVQCAMDALGERTGRRYRLFDYTGHPEPHRVLVLMGSAGQTALEAVEHLVARGERVGVLRVRLYRPFAARVFLEALPASTRGVVVLDRTKEPGAPGEPLYLDVVTALAEARDLAPGRWPTTPRVLGGRYGLGSKELTPAMLMAALAELEAPSPKNHFTLGIEDDVSGTSLRYDQELDVEADDVQRAVFYGLGADGTVSANKNSIKIIGEATPLFAQGYFVYDSKKSGAVTISHLRYGPRPIRSTYLVKRADFVACHQFGFAERMDVLELARPGATFLLNSPHRADAVWEHLPRELQQCIIDKRLRFYVVDAYELARRAGLGRRINTIMQTCWFALSRVLPHDEAIRRIKASIAKTYERRGSEVLERNFAAVDAALASLAEVRVPAAVTSQMTRRPAVDAAAPELVQRVTALMLAGHGDRLPVSAFPVDGTWPTGTAKWEKRNLAQEIPVWDAVSCIQCNKCALVCPHAAIRTKTFPPSDDAPPTFKAVPYRGKELAGQSYSVQVAPEDCTGCTLCVDACPAESKTDPAQRALAMAPQAPLRETECTNYAYFLARPEAPRSQVKLDVKGTQLLQPLFEYSGACTGCGETPYIKLLTQLFGDRLLIANATGCSSIFGGNLPTTPYTKNADGRGPAWANSLFEDNAEFGLGMRLAVDKRRELARELLGRLGAHVGETLTSALLTADQSSEAGIAAQRERVEALGPALARLEQPEARVLAQLADALVDKTVWLVGGDGWAYDIGYGGLDHVLASGRKVNILVLDTEVYSNTGGQQSKATPLCASAKFATAGKATTKKDLGRMAMAYGNVYVASVALGAKDAQAVRAILEAEAYPGTSLVIAYAHCIAHGYDLSRGLEQQRLAIDTGYWPLYRYDPRATDRPPLRVDSGAPKLDVAEYMRHEARFRSVEQADPERYATLLEQARRNIRTRFPQ